MEPISNPTGTQYGLYGNAWGSWDANGTPGTAPSVGIVALRSANSAALVGAFTDASGQIVSAGPMLIGNSFSAIVPAGATQLMMGMNDGLDWEDNSGAVLMNVAMNAPTGSTGGVGVSTHPFTDVTTDSNGNFTGTIAAQGNGAQAGGIGSLYAFQSVFTGTFTVSNAGNLSLNIFSNAGFILGVGGGASVVSGPSVNAPANGVTPFASLPVMGAYNAPQEANNVIVMNFPAAGSYPYELDYADSGAGGNPVNLQLNHLSLTMRAWQTLSDGRTITEVVPPTTGSLALSPQSPSTLNTGQIQTLSVNALDASGQPIVNLPIALSINGPNQQELLGSTNTAGNAVFSYIGNNAGTDTIEANANIRGMGASSNAVTVPWSIPSGGTAPSQANQPPVVSAGPNQQIMLPNGATLNGTVTDDGLPLGASLTQWWTQATGPEISEYAFGKEIVIDHTKVSNTDQQDFPVLISGTYPFLADSAYGGNVAERQWMGHHFHLGSRRKKPVGSRDR